MSDQGIKHGFSGILLFSLLAGVFGAVVGTVVSLILSAPGTLARAELTDLLIPAGAGFLIVFAATLASESWGLSYWSIKDELGGRVGPWQRAPAWFAHLMHRFLKDDGRTQQHRR
jgi:H+/Cl- antiporter ClcA